MMEAEKKHGSESGSPARNSGGKGSVGRLGGPVFFIVVGMLAGVGIKLLCLDVMNVSGSSMEPAIASGSRIWVGKLAYGLVKPFGDELVFRWKEPRRGDVVLYFYNNRAVVKRCVAVAGDRLEFSSGLGYSLTVNEKSIPLTEAQYQRLKHNQQVPQGMILALGDNYRESVDSRDYGFVPVKNVLGRIIGR